VFTNRTPILAFNDDALEVWQLFDGKRTVEEITDRLCSYQLLRSEVVAKVKEFVSACRDLGLIDIDTPELDCDDPQSGKI